MRIRNSKQLDARVEELTKKRDELRSGLLETSDHTRDVVSHVQTGLYAGQVALSIFRIVTNYRLSKGRKILKILITLGGLVATQLIRKKLRKQEK